MSTTPHDQPPPSGELAALYAVADDGQAAVLDELVVRAGLRWRCPCGFRNPAEDAECEGCPGPRVGPEATLVWRYATTGRTDEVCADSTRRIPGATRTFYLITHSDLFDTAAPWRLSLVGLDYNDNRIGEEPIGRYPNRHGAQYGAQGHENV